MSDLNTSSHTEETWRTVMRRLAEATRQREVLRTLVEEALGLLSRRDIPSGAEDDWIIDATNVLKDFG